MNLKHMALIHNVALSHAMMGIFNDNKLWKIARNAHLEELERYECTDPSVYRLTNDRPYVSEQLLDELVYPIFPNPIKRDTFTFKVAMPKKGAMRIVLQQLCPGGHNDVCEPAHPVVNVGTIDHVDFGRNLMDVSFTRAARPYETNFYR